MKRWQYALATTSVMLSPCLAGCAGDAPKHWGQLQQCLIGEPLAKDENVFARLRGVQLAESLQATGGQADWPNRCAEHATQLHASLPDDGKPGMVKRALAEQMGCDGACAFATEGLPLPAADKLWEAATRAELLSSDDVPPSSKPKPPAKTLMQADWPELVTAQLLDSRWSDSGELWLLLKGEKGHSFCSLNGDKAKCNALSGLPKFDAAAPVTFVQNGGEALIAGSTFAEGSGLSRSGYAVASNKPVPLFGDAGDEAYTGVGLAEKQIDSPEQPSPDAKPPEPEFDIRRVADGATKSQASLKLSARVRGPSVIHDFVAYVERDKDQKTVFKAKPLAQGGRLLGAKGVEYQAEFPGPFQVCQTKSGAAIGSYVPPMRQLGKPTSEKSSITVSLLEGDTWLPPIVADFPKQVGQFSKWRCGPGWGGFSWVQQVEQKLTLSTLICKKDGCKTQTTTWTQPDIKHVLLLGSVSDKVVLVYQSIAGDVRTRVATPSAIDKASSDLAFDVANFGGVELAKPKLLEGASTYLLLGEEGLRALLIGDKGGVKPVKS